MLFIRSKVPFTCPNGREYTNFKVLSVLHSSPYEATVEKHFGKRLDMNDAINRGGRKQVRAGAVIREERR